MGLLETPSRWHAARHNGGTCVVRFVHGSSSSEASRRGSDVNKQMDLVFYLFLTGLREVAEPSDTSTVEPHFNEHPWDQGFLFAGVGSVRSPGFSQALQFALYD